MQDLPFEKCLSICKSLDNLAYEQKQLLNKLYPIQMIFKNLRIHYNNKIVKLLNLKDVLISKKEKKQMLVLNFKKNKPTTPITRLWVFFINTTNNQWKETCTRGWIQTTVHCRRDNCPRSLDDTSIYRVVDRLP